jgi:hypothetical protein
MAIARPVAARDIDVGLGRVQRHRLGDNHALEALPQIGKCRADTGVRQVLKHLAHGGDVAFWRNLACHVPHLESHARPTERLVVLGNDVGSDVAADIDQRVYLRMAHDVGDDERLGSPRHERFGAWARAVACG